MGRVSTCQKNCNTIDLRGAQVNKSRRHPGNRDINNTQDRQRSRPQESTSCPTGSSNFTARDVAQFKEFQASMA